MLLAFSHLTVDHATHSRRGVMEGAGWEGRGAAVDATGGRERGGGGSDE